jgi:hypothetical protein
LARAPVDEFADANRWVLALDTDPADYDPIPVKALTFAPSPANGAKNDRVTGTVTIERPAPMDTRVLIYSNSQNATVGIPIKDQVTMTTATIDKGKTSGNLQVLTNDNKLSPGEHTTAEIFAFYTTDFKEQLGVESPLKGPPKPKATLAKGSSRPEKQEPATLPGTATEKR